MGIQFDHEVMEFDIDDVNDIERYKSLLLEIKEIQEQADFYRAKIEATLGVCEIGTYNSQPLVRWTNVTTSRLDSKRIKEHLSADLYELFSMTTTSRRFVIVKGDE